MSVAATGQCDINLLLSEKPQIPSWNEFITCMAKHYAQRKRKIT